MTEPNGNGGGSGGDDSWQRDNSMQYAPSRLEYSTSSSMPPAAAALTGGNIYMMPTAQDVFLHANSHQMHQPPLHQQLHHPHLRTMPPTSYIQHPEYAPATRNDGYTVVQTPHGEYVFYNGSDAKSYNNYELFSGKSYVPHHVIEQPQQQQKEHFQHFHAAGAGHINGQAASSSSDNNNTNFLNQLVGNMMPNMSGTYSPFGESPLPPQPIPSAAQSPSLMQTHISPPADILNANAPSSIEMPAAVASAHFSGIEQVQIVDGPPAPQVGSGQQTQRTNGSFVQSNIAAAEKKPRMVAEVKPRMSYSDVLSKNVFINRKNSAETNGNASAANNVASQTNGSSNPGAQQKSTKSKANHLSSDKKSSNYNNDDKDASGTAKSTSKSGPQINASGTRNSSNEIDTDANRENKANDESKGAKKRLQNGNASKNPIRAKSNQPDPMPKRRSDASVGYGVGGAQSAAKDDSAASSDKSQAGSATNSGSGYFYNITKNDFPSQADKTATSSTNIKSYQYRKSVSSSKGSAVLSRNGTGNTSRSEKSPQKRLQRSRDNTKYAVTKRILNTWLDFLLRFVYWLVALVCDVILLSSGILVDRVSAVFDYLRQSVASLRHEFLNSSGRPTTYFWSLLRSFDKRFNKESKWAFWRRLFAKKKPPEPTTDYYKNGRLPQTGEEAMYSLLNCKGKDAYR